MGKEEIAVKNYTMFSYKERIVPLIITHEPDFCHLLKCLTKQGALSLSLYEIFKSPVLKTLCNSLFSDFICSHATIADFPVTCIFFKDIYCEFAYS